MTNDDRREPGPGEKPEEIPTEEIPEYDPEIIPPSQTPWEDAHTGTGQQPFGKIRGFHMNLRCCGCSGSTLLVILAILLMLYLWR